MVVAVLGYGSSRGSSSSLPHEKPPCAPHSPHSTLAPLARLAHDAHHSIHALQRVSRRLLQESPASPSGKSLPPCMLPFLPSPRMRAAPSPVNVYPPCIPPSHLPLSSLSSRLLLLPSRAPARPTLSGGWSSRLQTHPLLISFLATLLCAAIILVIASIGFCMCCRQARRAESSFDEVFLANYIARSTHHYDPLLKPLGQPGGSGRLRQVGESMRQWAQILWRKRGAQEQGGGGGGAGRGIGGGSGRGEGEGESSGRAEGEALRQAGTQGRAEGTAGGEEDGDERGEKGKAGDQSAAPSNCRVEVGGERVGKEGKGGKDAQSPQPLAFSQRLDIATAIAEALCHLHTVAQPPLVHRRLCSSSVFLEVLPVVSVSTWERMWPSPRTDIYECRACVQPFFNSIYLPSLSHTPTPLTTPVSPRSSHASPLGLTHPAWALSC
ncbi:unnamed protein product [Closterium sp. Naga37s-1]|nr:unnamed protein product [Closterium sp. Naga37s-1]